MKVFFLSFLLLFGGLVAIPTEEILKMVQPFLPSNSVVLEAGSRDGIDSQKLSMMWPQGTVHTFEPLPSSFEVVQKNLMNYRNVYCYPLALSNKNQRVPFYIRPSEVGGCSLLAPKIYKERYLEEPIYVTSITIDDWASQNKIEHIDFMWLDMEGNELNALKGAVQILSSVKIIYTEVNLKEFWVGAPLYQELKKWLEENGFFEYWKKFPNSLQGDVIFVKKDLSK